MGFMELTAIQIAALQAKRAKAASLGLRSLSTEKKNQALLAVAGALAKKTDDILAANAIDMENLLEKRSDASKALQSRLILTKEKIKAIVEGVITVAGLPDPVGEVVKITERPNGLEIKKVRIPIGVIACVYESRPNVTVDIAALALKSGNACILRGGKESINSNTVLADIFREAVVSVGVDQEYLQFISFTDHAAVSALSKLDKYIDLIIPRGGEKLIDAVCDGATVPVLRHRKGITHIYAAASANLDMAIKIIHNAKTSNPSACNSLEHALIDAKVADKILPELLKKLKESGVEVRGDEKVQVIVPEVVLATNVDWLTEYLDYIISIKIVDGLGEAIAHINKYSTNLSDGIITEDESEAQKFVSAVDSAATYVNASTRFTDGSEFGLGAEIGINTSKIHGMGPMGLEELTVTRYIVLGNGQIR